MDPGLYSRIENGKQMPSVPSLIAIGKALGLADLAALERYWSSATGGPS
jgi:transcriptional regulator with XRE-family HTH domain